MPDYLLIRKNRWGIASKFSDVVAEGPLPAVSKAAAEIRERRATLDGDDLIEVVDSEGRIVTTYRVADVCL